MVRRKTPTFNKLVSIMTQAKTDDGLGGSTTTPVEHCKAWAAIWPVRAKEARENMREGVTVTHTVRIHYRAGITTAMTISYQSRTFEIKGIINPDEANRWLDMVCHERL